MATNDSSNKVTEVLNDKISKISGKILTVVFSVIVAIVSMMYNDAKTRITTLEDRVSFLYQDKVSRAEFKEEMNQLRLQNEGMKSDILTRQESMKSDILARLDLLIPRISRQAPPVPVYPPSYYAPPQEQAPPGEG